MSENYNAPQTRLEKVLTGIRQRLGPQRRKPQSSGGFDYGLQVGPALLGWSIKGNIPPQRTGYIYLNDPDATSAGPLWEFALTPKKRLEDVTRGDLACEFYGMNDARATNTFGPNYNGQTLVVPAGQIFFARLITNRTIVYVIRLARQGGTPAWGTMRAQYVEVSVAALPPEK